MRFCMCEVDEKMSARTNICGPVWLKKPPGPVAQRATSWTRNTDANRLFRLVVDDTWSFLVILTWLLFCSSLTCLGAAKSLALSQQILLIFSLLLLARSQPTFVMTPPYRGHRRPLPRLKLGQLCCCCGSRLRIIRYPFLIYLSGCSFTLTCTSLSAELSAKYLVNCDAATRTHATSLPMLQLIWASSTQSYTNKSHFELDLSNSYFCFC